MSKVRINDLARELEVKSRSILDALTAVGVTETKTHSSSIEADEAEKVRNYFKNRRSGGAAPKAAAETKPAFDLSHISKPGDALKAILARKQAEADARSMPPRPAVVVTPPAASAAVPAVRPVVQASAPAPVATPPAAPAPRRIMPQPRQGAQIVNPAPAPPAIASRPPAGAVIARPPVVVAPPAGPQTTHAHAQPVACGDASGSGCGCGGGSADC
jgi:translation initiation factor IF-2